MNNLEDLFLIQSRGKQPFILQNQIFAKHCTNKNRLLNFYLDLLLRMYSFTLSYLKDEFEIVHTDCEYHIRTPKNCSPLKEAFIIVVYDKSPDLNSSG